MEGILSYIFVEPFPWTWLVQDVIALLLSFLVLAYIVKREQHPVVCILEAFAFVFLFASIYENAAIVMGLYSYGRSLVMIGFVPASVPLIEVCVLIVGLWFLDKTSLPTWAKPPIIGLFGMLQDLSLDPLAIRQVYTVAGQTSARWNWLVNSTTAVDFVNIPPFDPATDADILHVPVFNFPGWMLIMLYGTTCLLVGRWWYRKSGYRPWVGVIYPFVTMVVALGLMVSPISRLLLWLGPICPKGSASEWVLLAFHLALPAALLIFLWRGKMTGPFTRDDLPVFVVPTVLHLTDIVFTLIGGFTEILWIVLLASAVQTALLAFAYLHNRHAAAPRVP